MQDSIQSVIDQSYANIELIIIDDGSKDSSVEKIQQMIPACENRFLRFEFRTRPNKGLSVTLNEALAWCEGEYYSAIASDDLMVDRKTEIQVNYLEENENCAAVFGGYDLIDEENKILLSNIGTEKTYCFDEIFMHDHELPAPTQMIVMNAIKAVRGYPEGVVIEDWYMWLKLSENSQLHYIPEKLSLYRSHSDNISKKINIMHGGRVQIINNYPDHPLYSKAMLNVKWVWLSELRAAKSSKYFISFLIFFMFNPLYSMEKFKKRYLM